MPDTILRALLDSDEPAVRLKVLKNVLGKKPGSAEVKQARQEVKSSPRVERLLSQRTADGTIPYHPYAKWNGAHWVLAALADLGYPSGDESLVPLREQVYAWLLGHGHRDNIPVIAGRVRRCASQEGNALYALLTLGLADERTEELARSLRQWQWPDGGWNCDRRPRAVNPSFMESLLPLRALALHARLTGNAESRGAAERAAEVFLTRRLFRRRRDGSVIREEFLLLHYPCYWHYDILFGLSVLAEAGWVKDARCREALGLLESKRLPDGGLPAEKKYYRPTETGQSGRSLVDWGGTSKRHMNPFVTAEALFVLKQAGRFTLKNSSLRSIHES